MDTARRLVIHSLIAERYALTAGTRVERRLAAILAADIVGYSRLMEADETGTLSRVKALRSDLLYPKLEFYGGRVVKTTGDGTLIEFPSAVHAVQHAVDVQRLMAQQNSGKTDAVTLELRIGINLGDVIVDGDDIYGEGVNIAARLESLAEPGGILVSGAVFEHVQGKLDAAFEHVGARTLKNISKPVQVYQVRLGAAGVKPLAAFAAADKPSIAVLPFTNMSGDAEQEYFADGIAEDIITALARVRQFLVIARNTTFTFKGRSVDIQTLAKDLNVRYVLEGSVRKAANRVRITAQLIEGTTGNHIWADRYDRELQDIFAVQDEITKTVVGAIGPELSRAEQERARSKPPSSMHAWDYYQRGLWNFWHFTMAGVQQSIPLFEKAVELDPTFSSALATLSYAHATNFIRGYTNVREAELQAAYELAIRAVAVGKDDALAHWALGMAHNFKKAHLPALERLSIALELNPSFAQAHSQLGLVLCFCGRAAEAFPHFDQAERISPKDPFGWLAWFGRGWAHFFLEHFEEAAACARKAALEEPQHAWSYVIALVAHVRAGQPEAASQVLRELLEVKKDFSISFAVQTGPFDAVRMAIVTEALRKGGVPE